mgnify:CR=1 FL=1
MEFVTNYCDNIAAIVLAFKKVLWIWMGEATPSDTGDRWDPWARLVNDGDMVIVRGVDFRERQRA